MGRIGKPAVSSVLREATRVRGWKGSLALVGGGKKAFLQVRERAREK